MGRQVFLRRSVSSHEKSSLPAHCMLVLQIILSVVTQRLMLHTGMSVDLTQSKHRLVVSFGSV